MQPPSHSASPLHAPWRGVRLWVEFVRVSSAPDPALPLGPSLSHPRLSRWQRGCVVETCARLSQRMPRTFPVRSLAPLRFPSLCAMLVHLGGGCSAFDTLPSGADLIFEAKLQVATLHSNLLRNALLSRRAAKVHAESSRGRGRAAARLDLNKRCLRVAFKPFVCSSFILLVLPCPSIWLSHVHTCSECSAIMIRGHAASSLIR